ISGFWINVSVRDSQMFVVRRPKMYTHFSACRNEFINKRSRQFFWIPFLQPARIRPIARMVTHEAIQIRIPSIKALRVFRLPAANRWVEHSRFPRDGLEDEVAADRNVACMQALSQMFCVAPDAHVDLLRMTTVSKSAHWPQNGHFHGQIMQESSMK
ncbi:MAG: hypothetical protein ACK5E3_16250, partial [Planctomycetota bacterium]